MAFYNCDSAAVITNSRFTRGAIDLAERNNCVLIGEDEIPDFVMGRACIQTMPQDRSLFSLTCGERYCRLTLSQACGPLGKINMVQDGTLATTKKRGWNWGLVAAIVSALAVVVSAIAAILSCMTISEANRINAANAENNIYHTFQQTLSQLSDIEQKASSAKESLNHGSCTGGGCLGSLALGETYFNQYEVRRTSTDACTSDRE